MDEREELQALRRLAELEAKAGYVEAPPSEGIPQQRQAAPMAAAPMATAPEEQSKLRQMGQQIQNTYGGLVRGAGSIGSALMTPVDIAARAARESSNPLIKASIAPTDWMARQLGLNPEDLVGRTDRGQAMDAFMRDVVGADTDSLGYQGGKVVAEVGGTGGVGAGMANALTRVGLAKAMPAFVNALRTGGFGAGNFIPKVTAGAATGGATAALINPEDAAPGAAIGAGLVGAGKAVAPVARYLSGKTAEMRAAEIARQAAGPQLSSIRAAAGVAPEAETAAQAIAGVDRPQIQALGALMAERDAANVLRGKVGAQTTAEQNVLSRMAGGSTQTAAMQEAQRMKDALNVQTRPIREEALGAANKTTATVQKAEEISKRGREFGVPPGEGNAYLYSPESIERQVALATAKSAESRLASIKAAGLEPLNVKGMVSSIEKKLSTPDIGIPDLNSKALKNVSSKLSQWADENGVISGEALYAIRKSAINDVIEQLMPNATQSAKNARAASVMTEVKPMIDNAIEKAGGKGWKDYLHTYEMGMRGIDQTKMAAQLMDMYQNNKSGFAKLIGGNDPTAVEKIFGPGSFDVVQEMGSKIQKLRPIAANIERSASMAEQAKAGSANLQEIIKSNTSGIRIPSLIPKSTIPNAVLDEMSSKLGPKVMDQLEKGFASGQSLNELLSKVPSEYRNFISRALSRNGLVRSVPYSLSSSNQNALNQPGQQ